MNFLAFSPYALIIFKFYFILFFELIKNEATLKVQQ
jgi:hypothetical protein